MGVAVADVTQKAAGTRPRLATPGHAGVKGPSGPYGTSGSARRP